MVFNEKIPFKYFKVYLKYTMFVFKYTKMYIYSQLLHQIQLKEAPEAVFVIATTTIEYHHTNVFFNVAERTELPDACLLLVVIDADARQCREGQSTMENILQPMAAVTCWYMPLSSFNEQLVQGGYFACTVYNQAERLFMAADAGFAPPAAAPLQNRYEGHWHRRAAEFFAGAELYIVRKQYAMAAFCLHQCAEQCLTSVVYNKCGYRPCTHNLLLLYRYACWFEPGLQELFPPGQQKEHSLLHLLQQAYTASRYTGEYTIKGSRLQTIKEKVEALLERAGTMVLSCE